MKAAQRVVLTGMPPVIDQGQLGSCVSNAIANAIQYFLMKKYGARAGQLPSRLFNYFNLRVFTATRYDLISGSAITSHETRILSDNGADVLEGFFSINLFGWASEDTQWPYISDVGVNSDGFSQLMWRMLPNPKMYFSSGMQDQFIEYDGIYPNRTDTISNVCNALENGQLVCVAMHVWDEFRNGFEIIRMPYSYTKYTEYGGAHCVLIYGYDNVSKLFNVQNSWGVGWGKDGYCQMPYEYLVTYCFEIVTISGLRDRPALSKPKTSFSVSFSMGDPVKYTSLSGDVNASQIMVLNVGCVTEVGTRAYRDAILFVTNRSTSQYFAYITLQFSNSQTSSACNVAITSYCTQYVQLTASFDNGSKFNAGSGYTNGQQQFVQSFDSITVTMS